MKTHSFKRSIATGTLLLSVIAIAPIASGQVSDEDRQAARAAANGGLQAFEAGEYQEAIEQFERANQSVRAITHNLYIARAHAKLGNLLKAWELYLEIARVALETGAPTPFVQARRDARKELRELDARIPRITIQASGAEWEIVQVTMNNTPLPDSKIGVEMRVNPGVYTIHGKSDLSKPKTVTITIAEGQREVVVLDLTDEGEKPLPPAPPPEVEQSSSTLRYVGIATASVGAIGVGLGVAFNFRSTHKRLKAKEWSYRESEDDPDGTKRYRENSDRLDHDADQFATASYASLIAGGALLIGGVTLILLAPTGSDCSAKCKASTFRPWVGLGSAGVSGAF